MVTIRDMTLGLAQNGHSNIFTV